MKKISSILAVFVLVLSFFALGQVSFAEEAAKEVAPAAVAAATPAAPAAVEAADVVPVDAAEADALIEEEFDDVAVLKEAATELEKAGKTELAQKVRDIAEGMDW